MCDLGITHQLLIPFYSYSFHFSLNMHPFMYHYLLERNILNLLPDEPLIVKQTEGTDRAKTYQQRSDCCIKTSLIRVYTFYNLMAILNKLDEEVKCICKNLR